MHASRFDIDEPAVDHPKVSSLILQVLPILMTTGCVFTMHFWGTVLCLHCLEQPCVHAPSNAHHYEGTW